MGLAYRIALIFISAINTRPELSYVTDRPRVPAVLEIDANERFLRQYGISNGKTHTHVLRVLKFDFDYQLKIRFS